MRIRKRFLNSSISSVSLTPDPQPLVQQHQLQSVTESRQTDPLNRLIIGAEKPRLIVHRKEELDEIQDEEKNNYIIRDNSNFVPDSNIQTLTSDQVAKLFEEEKVIPPKKRIVREDSNGEEKGKMKSKTNKKCVRPEEKDEEGSERSSSKIRGSEIMEGSRCSRVNGRGWRCGQQTLIGYSLCEHHLGKGRLRSVSSVRSRGLGKNSRPVVQKKSELEPQPQPKPEPDMIMDDVYDDSEDDDGVMMVKKKKKVGMVKARSIRSLLGQTDGAHPVLGGDDDNKST